MEVGTEFVRKKPFHPFPKIVLLTRIKVLVALVVSIPSRALPRIKLLIIRVLGAAAKAIAPFVPAMSRIVLLSMIVPVVFV